MPETPAQRAARQQAAIDAAEASLDPQTRAALAEWLATVRGAIIQPGAPPQMGAFPTIAQWSEIALNGLAQSIATLFEAIWNAAGIATGALGFLPPDDPAVASIAWALRTARDQAISDHVTAALARMVGLPADSYTLLRARISDAAAAGASPDEQRELASELLDPQAPDWDWRAQRIARTEAASLVNSATLAQGLAQAQATGQVLRKQWLTREDERVRHDHAAVHGAVVGLRETFDVGGYAMAHPGDVTAPPAQTANCRCHLVILAPDEVPVPTDDGAGFALAAGGPMNQHYQPAVSLRRDAPGTVAPAVNALAAASRAAVSRLAAATAPDTQAPAQADGQLPDGWRGVLAPLDVLSGDARMLVTPEALRARPLPLPLLAQEALSGGHDGAVGVGRIDRVWAQNGMLMGEGAFDLADAEGQAWARRLADGFAGGVSVDLDDVVVSEHFINTETGEEMDPEDAINLLWFDPDGASKVDYQMHMDDWRLIGATMVYQPAFFEAQIEPVYGFALTGDVEQWPTERAASLRGQATARTAAITAGQRACASLLAAGVPQGPADPPGAWFEAPTLPGPTPITVTDDGRVYGHAALWSSCHTGSPDVCIAPPRSSCDYALFHTGEVVTRENERLPVGRLTVGGGHADPYAPLPGAIAHYDHTGSVVAIVRASEDAHGIVVAGALHPAATRQQVADLMLSPPSGDWRRVGGRLELVAILAVNTPGFPVTRPRAAAAGQRQVSLVASSVPPQVSPAGRHALGRNAVAAQNAGISPVLARSLRRGRIEQLAAKVRADRDPWAATRAQLAAIEAGGGAVYALARAAARRHGFTE